MSSNLPEKLLGISIDEPGESRRHEDGEADDVELERFLFVEIGEQRLALPIEEVRTLTDAPETLTRIPRSPPAIEGVVDLRGEITAVIDTRVHFPVDEPPGTKQKLIVFDRPTDRQPAAIRVDRVLGVESIPVDNVRAEDEIEDRTIAGGALEHPLVVAIVEQERHQERASRAEAIRQPMDGAGTAASTARTALSTEADRAFGLSEAEPTESPEPDERGESTVLVETTAVIDVTRLLIASGHQQ